MRQLQFEYPCVVPLKLRLISIVVHRIPGAFFEHKEEQAGPEQFHEFILMFGSAVRNFPEQVIEIGKIVRDRFLESKDQVALFLCVSIAVFFLFPPDFLLTFLTRLRTLLMTACALSLFHGEAPYVKGVHDVADDNMSMCSDPAVILQKKIAGKGQFSQKPFIACFMGVDDTFYECSLNS